MITITVTSIREFYYLQCDYCTHRLLKGVTYQMTGLHICYNYIIPDESTINTLQHSYEVF